MDEKVQKIYWLIHGGHFEIRGEFFLSCVWNRTETHSLLLQSLLATAEPSESLYSSIGDLCMDQLISLRHRGAFSTVAQTFTQCCARTRASTRPNIKQLIFTWHEVGRFEQCNA